MKLPAWLRPLLRGDRTLLRHPGLLLGPFSLRRGRRYRLRQPMATWPAGTVLRFIGTHDEPMDRSWLTHYDFVSEDAVSGSLPPARVPRDLAASYALFDDVAEPTDAQWQNQAVMQGLHHRATRARTLTAEKVRSGTHGLPQILPELVQQALAHGARDNAYRQALLRLGAPARDAAEAAATALPPELETSARRLLALLGSRHFRDEHLRKLNDADQQQIRFAIDRLVDIGDRDVIPALEPLRYHRQWNVRFDAERAIEHLRSAPGRATQHR